MKAAYLNGRLITVIAVHKQMTKCGEWEGVRTAMTTYQKSQFINV
jgi:hypothetical protein